jgi:tetratricopeptide (TPR) repeat protein
MAACPSCAAPLDADGVCTTCGALSRGYFRGLDLGPPQIAAAVSRGLDFYRLLEIPRDADTNTIARRYQRLRALFPDTPERLAPAPARKLELLEVAGRVLTDPRLRATYDSLREAAPSQPDLAVVRCTYCGAPLEPQAPRCQFCGAARPVEEKAPIALPTTPPPVEPVDYYALLGLSDDHLHPRPQAARVIMGNDPRRPGGGALPPDRPPTPGEVDAAALALQQQILMQPSVEPIEREAQLSRYELARRLLRDERRRPQYDALLLMFRNGRLGQPQLEALSALEDSVRAEIDEETGGRSNQHTADDLLRQAQGLIDAGVPREALPLLRRALQMPSAPPEAHQMFVQTMLANDDPLLIGGHQLRQIQASIAATAGAGRPIPDGDALLALCAGLIAREEGRTTEAEAALSQALSTNPQLSAAARGLAAMALARGANDEAIAHARQALLQNRDDEQALLLIAAASLRARRPEQAREAAASIARLRGPGWSADAVLRDIGG